MFSVDFEELKLCSMKAPLVEKFDYKQDRSLAQANVASRFHKSACLRLAFEILLNRSAGSYVGAVFGLITMNFTIKFIGGHQENEYK